MDWKIFSIVLALGVALVAAQGVFAYFDGYGSQAQLRARGIIGWSFWEHGGMWADVFIISPIVAIALSKYRLDMSWWGLGLLIGTVFLTLGMIEMYRQFGKVIGDHCTHDGKTVVAGWIHGVFAVAAIWVCLEIYLGWTTPIVSKQDIVLFSVLLTPFFYLGVKKFSPLWVMNIQDRWQVTGLTAAVWIAAIVRLVRTA